MATLRAIRNRITSVEKIEKITGALEVVALTRLRRMEQETVDSRDYFERIRQLLFDVAYNINFKLHPFLEERKPVKTVGLIAIFSDKGLCGNFNANIANRLSDFFLSHKDKRIKAVVIGKKGIRYFKKILDYKVLSTYPITEKQALEEGILEIAQSLVDKFLSQGIDEIYLLYSKFRLHLLGEAKVIKLLPFVIASEKMSFPSPRKRGTRESKQYKRDYIYEPSAYEIFDRLVREYIINQIHQGVLESRSAEEMSRMLAMKSATDNAEEMISDLRLIYNKNRQAQITKELTEIISAAEAAV